MNTLVANIKDKTAELVTLCETHKQLLAQVGQIPAVADTEINRLLVQAQTTYVDAAEFAVRAALMLSDDPIA